MAEKTQVEAINRSIYDITDAVNSDIEVESGLTSAIVAQISEEKHDPDWMREVRQKSLKIYQELKIPEWGPPIDGLNMDNIVTYVRPKTDMKGTWDEVPEDIKNTFERLGIPQAELEALQKPFEGEVAFSAYPRTADVEQLKSEVRDADALILANMP